jgi:tetratricopeptide (TPR) repeat protein
LALLASNFVFKMKIYLHLEETGGPPHLTVIRKIDKETTTLQELTKDFVSVYNATYEGFELVASNLQLFNRDGKRLSSLRSLASVILSDRDDIVLTILNKLTTAKEVPSLHPKKPSVKDNTDNRDTLQGKKMFTSKDLIKLKTEITNLIDAKSYRHARTNCEKYLANYSEEAYFFYDALARMKLANDECDAAIKNALLAVTAAKKASVDSSLYNFTLAKAFFLSVDRFDEADEVLEKILSKKFSSSLPLRFSLDVRALRAECLFNLNQHEAAASLVNEHMSWEGAEEHMPTLLAYSRFAMTYRKFEEPVRAILKAIILSPKDHQIQRMLSDLLTSDAGYSHLLIQVVRCRLHSGKAFSIMHNYYLHNCYLILIPNPDSNPDTYHNYL